MKKIIVLIFLLVLVGGLLPIQPASANISTTLKEAGKSIDGVDETGKPKSSVPKIVGSIVNVLLSVLGVVLLIIIIYAGFLWMTAQGEEAQVKKAKTMISQAVIGMVILLSAYAISIFIVDKLTSATGSTSEVEQGNGE